MTKKMKRLILGVLVASGVSFFAISGVFVLQTKMRLDNTSASHVSQGDHLYGECGPYECGDPPSRLPYGGLPVPG